MDRKKTQKGTVLVRSVKNWLRLVCTFCDGWYFFALELSDTRVNRAIAEMKARQIERVITNDLFDLTLKKDLVAYQWKVSGLSVTDVLKQYIRRRRCGSDRK